MSDERSRRLQRASSESASVSVGLAVIAGLMLVGAVLAYGGTDPGAQVSRLTVLLALGGVALAPFSAGFAAVSYVTSTLAETERLP